MKCIVLFALMMAVVGTNAASYYPYFLKAGDIPAPYWPLQNPNFAPKVLIEDGVKTKLVYDAPIAYSVPAAYPGAYPASKILIEDGVKTKLVYDAPIAYSVPAAYPGAYPAPLVIGAPAPIAVGVPKATYTAINHGIVHTEDLPGHFESVVIENNDEAPTLPPPTEVEQPAAPMEPMEPKEE